MDNIQLAIVVPCYNEEAVLHETARRLLAVAAELAATAATEARLVFVDDGSGDRTWPIIEELAAAHPEVGGLRLAHNAGHQHALWAGLEAAQGADAVISIDADLQDDVGVIGRMVADFRAGSDIVFGVRNSRATDSWFKRTSAELFYHLMHHLGGDVVYNHADFRLMSHRAVAALLCFPERNLFLRGMVRALGFRQSMVYYDRAERFAGESKYPLRRMLAFAWDGITSFSMRPLRLIVELGMLFILVAFGVIVWALVIYAEGRTLPGWTSLLVSVWFVGGAILLALGITGEYVGKIYSEVKRRPRYFIAATAGHVDAKPDADR